MKTHILTGAIAISTIMAGVGVSAPSAQAAAIACSSYTGFRLDATGRGISPNNGCQVGTFSQDSAANVNADAFFGTTTWSLLAKSDEDSGKNFFDPTKGKPEPGDFDFSALGINFATQKVLVTFKGPDEFPIVGYLANSAIGEWTSPFTDFNPQQNPRVRDTSHISIFTSPADVIPTPAMLPGLIGMGVAALRKKKQSDEQVDA